MFGYTLCWLWLLQCFTLLQWVRKATTVPQVANHSLCKFFCFSIYSTIYWKWFIISNEWCPFYYSMIQQSNFITQSVNKTNVLQKSNSDGLMSQWYLWTLQSYNPNAFAPQISWNSLTFSAVVVLVPRRQSECMQTANELVIPLWMHKVGYKTQSSNFSTAFLFVCVCLSSKFIFCVFVCFCNFCITVFCFLTLCSGIHFCSISVHQLLLLQHFCLLIIGHMFSCHHWTWTN